MGGEGLSRRDWLKGSAAAGLSLAMPWLSLAAPRRGEREFELQLIFTNDQHAHVEPARMGRGRYGGYARHKTVIDELRREARNPLVLSAGDVFQGTLYFNVYEGLADLACMNAIGYQCMTLGNHEFDRGPEPLKRFAEAARFPLLAANLDCSAEPLLADLVRPSTVIRTPDGSVGIVGAITPSLPEIASPGPNVTLKPLRESVQAEVDRLRDEVQAVILVTHIGYAEDLELARQLRGVRVILGGHSHTLLGGHEIPDFPAPRGEFPTIVPNADGEDCAVFQAWCWGLVVGTARVVFGEGGRLLRVSENRAIPVPADTVTPDPDIENLLLPLRKPVADIGNARIGETRNGIRTGNLRTGESPMANLIADAQLEATRSQGARAALMNSGGVRNSFEPGPITFGQAITVQPFNNTLVVLELTGAELRAALEHGVRGLPDGAGGFLHISRGSSYVADARRPVGDRITEIVIDGERVEPEKTYRLCVNSFIAGGGDGHTVIRDAKGFRRDTGLLDIDALVDYIRKNSPVDPQVEGRIRILGMTAAQHAAAWRVG